MYLHVSGSKIRLDVDGKKITLYCLAPRVVHESTARGKGELKASDTHRVVWLFCISSSLLDYASFSMHEIRCRLHKCNNHLEIRMGLWQSWHRTQCVTIISCLQLRFNNATKYRHRARPRRWRQRQRQRQRQRWKKKESQILTSLHLTLVLNVNAHNSYNPKRQSQRSIILSHLLFRSLTFFPFLSYDNGHLIRLCAPTLVFLFLAL